jgi:hypothetical protein
MRPSAIDRWRATMVPLAREWQFHAYLSIDMREMLT